MLLTHGTVDADIVLMEKMYFISLRVKGVKLTISSASIEIPLLGRSGRLGLASLP
jgi:hypothetical protein